MKRARAFTDTSLMSADLQASLRLLREHISADPYPHPDGRTEEALDTVETFCAVALRVFAKTNPSKIRSEAVTVELSTLV